MIYEFNDYRKYLEKTMNKLPNKGRGFKTQLSKQLNCKTSFISLIFNGRADLSLEQGQEVNELLKHSESEADYFLLMIQYARAGSKKLRDRFKNKMTLMQSEQLRLKNRFTMGTLEKKEDEFKYFSSADYSLVHILTTIPEFQTKESMLKKLKIDPDRLEQILNYLINIGLVKFEHDQYTPGPHRMHLPDDASIISTHHTNWRIQAIKDCQSPSTKDLHYSSVVSIHKSDFPKLKAILIKNIEDVRNVIKDSESEMACSFCCDFFEIK